MSPEKEGLPIKRLDKTQLDEIRKRDILNSCHLPPIQDPILDSIIFMVMGERQDRHLLLREVRALEQALERDEKERISSGDMLHFVDRAERVLRAITIDRHDPEQMMSTFKLSNTCKAWREELGNSAPKEKESE